MNKRNTLLPVVMAAMLAAAGAQAQSLSASGSSDDPPKAGEVSTQTMGAPNAKTTNSPYTDQGVLVTPTAPGAILAPAPAPRVVTTVPWTVVATVPGPTAVLTEV